MRFVLTKYFGKQMKALEKKYPHVKDDLYEKLMHFDARHEISIGRSIYKIRIKSSDMAKGKSGGLRAYMYLYKRGNALVPLHIYSKSKKRVLSESELEHHFREVRRELQRLQGKKAIV